MSSTDVVQIARCPEHGLHGARDACFVCGGPVDQVELLPLDVARTPAGIARLITADRDLAWALQDALDLWLKRHDEGPWPPNKLELTTRITTHHDRLEELAELLDHAHQSVDGPTT